MRSSGCGRLGDCVLTTPALDILKRFRPDLRLAVVVENRFRDIFEGNPDLDEILAPELVSRSAASVRNCASISTAARAARG